MTSTLKTVARPVLGRATDKRVTQDYLTARGLPGNPFDPAQDVDLVDEINGALTYMQAQVATVLPGSLTRAQRRALTNVLDGTTIRESDTGVVVTYIAALPGWRDQLGGNPDYVAPPPIDTGDYT